SPGDGSTTVDWVAPDDDGGSPITGYTVTSDPDGLTAYVDGATTEAVVQGLTNGTTYTFTVAAENDDDTGPPSDPSNAVTPEGPPPPPTISSFSPTKGAAGKVITILGTGLADTTGLEIG